MKKPLKYTIPGSMTPRAAETGPAYSAGPAVPAGRPIVTATDAKNQFADLLETALRDGPVFISKHGTPKAVLISVEEYQHLRGPLDAAVDRLRREWDERFDRMQTPESQAAIRAAFDMTPEDLSKAAVEAARKRE